MKRPDFKSLISATAFILLFVGLQAPSALAIDETHYSELMGTLVWPFYGSGVDGSFKGKGGFTIKYRKWENPHEIGAIVLVPGRVDPFLNFAETIYDFASHGYSIYTLDHRGQASSDRLLADPQLGYVKHFDDYVDDLKTFVDTVVKAVPHKRTFILSHSMGAAISTIYTQKYTSDFDAVVLAAPMFDINTAPYAPFIARMIIWWNMLTGKGKEYAPDQQDFDTAWTFESNHLTSDPIRWQTMHDMFVTYPFLEMGGATNRWVDQSFKAGDRIHDFADDYASQVLVFSAGQDQLVEQDNIDYFCQHAQHCTQVPAYPTSKHEMFLERDEIRTDMIDKILDFYGQF